VSVNLLGEFFYIWYHYSGQYGQLRLIFSRRTDNMRIGIELEQLVVGETKK